MENRSDANHSINTSLSKYGCIYASQKGVLFLHIILNSFSSETI